MQKILQCTRGIVFLGTPHRGSAFATWAALLAQSIGLIKQTNSKILDVLEKDSEVLARIQTDFHTMLRARANGVNKSIEVTCFYEELPLPGVGEVRIALRISV
jgi:protein SERAC1